MNEIFAIHIVANYYYDEEDKKVACQPEESTWIDSYWTDEAAAVAEAERLWSNDSDEMYEKIVVFGRKLNMGGSGKNEWDHMRDRRIKSWQ